MKVCFVSEAHPVHTRRWAARIARAGHEVHLLSASRDPISGVRIRQTPLYDENHAKTLANAARARLAIRKLRPDVIHLFGLYSAQSMFLLPLFAGMKNLLVTPWGTDVVWDFPEPEPLKSRLIKSFLLSRANRITALSHYLGDCIKGYLKKDVSLDHVPWGADVEIFHPQFKQAGQRPFTIGITKAFTEKYGHVHLINAFERILAGSSENRPRLVIMGKGPLEGDLKKLVLDRKMSGHVTFVPFASTQEGLRDAMAEFDVYAMPSVYKSETLGVAAIEASAMGIPVVASRIGGIPEVVLDGRTGLLVPPGDEKALAKALSQIMGNPAMADQMGRAGREHAAREFDQRDSVSKMLASYEKVRARGL